MIQTSHMTALSHALSILVTNHTHSLTSSQTVAQVMLINPFWPKNRLNAGIGGLTRSEDTFVCPFTLKVT